MTTTFSILDNIRIASPCSADWNRMAGDDRSRFCESCQKHVYNFAAMTRDEALQLIREKEGNVCGRLFRRGDGTVLTSDCPVGAKAVWARTKQLVRACAAALLIGAGGVLIPNIMTARESASPTGGPVVQKAVALWDDLMVWMGYRTRTAIVGDICVTPSVQMNDPGSTGTSVDE